MRAFPPRARTVGQRAAPCRALLLLFACAALPVAAEPSVSVAGSSDSLSLIVQDASLRGVLEVVAGHQRLAVEAHAALDETVSVEYLDVPLAGLVRQLLRDYNFTLELTPGADVAGRLWIHPRGTDVRPLAAPLAFGRLSADDPDAALARLARGAADERLDATAVFAAFGGDDSFVALTNALHDPEPAVREEAVAGLADRHPAESVHLLATALGDPSLRVRETALDALADVDNDAAADAIAPLLAAGDPALRRHAIDALGSMSAARAGHLLQQARADADAELAALAAEYLAERQ